MSETTLEPAIKIAWQSIKAEFALFMAVLGTILWAALSRLRKSEKENNL